MYTVKILQNNQDVFRPTVTICEDKYIKSIINILENDINIKAYSIFNDGEIVSPFTLNYGGCKKIRRIIYKENEQICPVCFSGLDKIIKEDYTFNALDIADNTTKPYTYKNKCLVCGNNFNFNNEIIRAKNE